MALSQKSCALLLAVVAAVCIQLYQAHDFPRRCSCHETIPFTRKNITDFRVDEKSNGCDKVELIVTITNPDNSTVERCLDTDKPLGKAFLACWKNKNKDESRKQECIKRRKSQ